MNTVKCVLLQAIERLGASDSPMLDAELLLCHVLRAGRTALRVWPERRLNADQLHRFETLVDRRGHGEPVSYLLGRAGFMDFDLEVNNAVLIPRPETELLVELALATMPGTATGIENHRGTVQIADLGTGSGAIAIALARRNPDWRILATDISEAALALARRNAAALEVNNIAFRRSSWCKALSDATCDMIIANPPYVAKGDPALHADCAFEPPIALFAGADGLEAMREIIFCAKRCLKPGGWLLLEHGHDQRVPVAELLATNGYTDIHSRQDHASQDRLARARRGN